jgi:hypothetical protein
MTDDRAREAVRSQGMCGELVGVDRICIKDAGHSGVHGETETDDLQAIRERAVTERQRRTEMRSTWHPKYKNLPPFDAFALEDVETLLALVGRLEQRIQQLEGELVVQTKLADERAQWLLGNRP